MITMLGFAASATAMEQNAQRTARQSRTVPWTSLVLGTRNVREEYVDVLPRSRFGLTEKRRVSAVKHDGFMERSYLESDRLDRPPFAESLAKIGRTRAGQE